MWENKLQPQHRKNALNKIQEQEATQENLDMLH